MQIIKIIRNDIENKIENNEELASTCLKQILAYVKGTVPPLEAGNEEPLTDKEQTPISETVGLEKQYLDLKCKHDKEMADILAKLAIIEGSKTAQNNKLENAEKPNDLLSEASWSRREFKIFGQIGEPGQTDKLSFVSLTHQIDSGLKRKYKESEIVDAVIRAISPHSSLRSYIETLPGLSLAKLRKILRVHYREKTASELYQQLATVCQQAKETPQQFLLRALDCRNKVNFASQEADCEFDYGFTLIQKTFLKSFETGLRDDILATNLRPILRASELSDEELMKQVNELASHQAERQNKLSTQETRTRGEGDGCRGNKEGRETGKTKQRPAKRESTDPR